MNNLVLCGNPNTGKTTIFNAITNSKERVGNFHGVTSNCKVKKIKLNNTYFNVVDLPGIYSLNEYTLEEKISIDFIKNLDEDDIILYIVDENKIKKNLYLFLTLKEIGYNIVLIVNSIDKSRINIDYEKLKKLLNCQVIRFSKSSFKKKLENYLDKKTKFLIPNYLRKIVKENQYINSSLKNRFLLLKTLEINQNNHKNITENIENKFIYLVRERYNYIELVCKQTNYTVKKTRINPIDNLLTNKYSCFFIFILVVVSIFFLTFGSIGNFISILLQDFVFELFEKINLFLIKRNTSLFLTKFISEGVYLGVSILITFLPQLFILFICLSFLEESGYLSRLCFIFDDFFNKIGLSGKSVFTMLMCFGCSTSACYQARTNQDSNTKIKLALITPYFSCSAKIPVYLLLTNCFYPSLNLLIILGIYLLGIFIAFVTLAFYNKLIESKEESFILETTTLKFPPIKNILFSSIRQVFEFFIKVGSLILVFNVVIWILANCNYKLLLVEDISNSILYKLGAIISIIFKPLGFGSPGISSALICGVIAKEIIVSTFGIFNAKYGIPLEKSIMNPLSIISLTPTSAISFLVFTLLYCPCISNYLVIREEVGKKYAKLGIIVQFVIAYITTFIIYNLIKLIM